MSICKSPKENVAYNFVLTSPAVPSMSYEMGSKWPYNCCILGVLLSGFVESSQHLSPVVRINIFLPVFLLSIYNSTDSATTWKNSCFILSGNT